jgi:hypothetical protein
MTARNGNAPPSATLSGAGGGIEQNGQVRSMASTIVRRPAPSIQPAVPIVIIHRGNSDQLACSLAQAKHSSPASTIYLLGDDSNHRYPWVEHAHAADYSAGAGRFAAVYQHFSTHPVGFELMCFQRWFMLREFLAARGIARCLYLDSDVLLYADATDEIRKFSAFDFTLCWNTIGCVFFLNQLEGLNSLCEFMMRLYSGRERYLYDRMIAHFAVRQRHRLAGGACDMTALQLYNELNFGRVGEAALVVDGSVYDPNINVAHPGFEMANNIKKVVWDGGKPYGTLVRSGQRVRFNSLHFNGHAKSLMPQFCTADLGDPLAQAPARLSLPVT